MNLEPQAEPAAMAVRVELQVLGAQAVVHLARLGPTGSTATEATQAMVATEERALTERRESLE